MTEPKTKVPPVPFRIGYNQRSRYVFIENTRSFTQFRFTIPEARAIANALLQAAAAAREAEPVLDNIYIEMLEAGK